jgi:hypothetical protein
MGRQLARDVATDPARPRPRGNACDDVVEGARLVINKSDGTSLKPFAPEPVGARAATWDRCRSQTGANYLLQIFCDSEIN